jgi:hypothetical protein
VNAFTGKTKSSGMHKIGFQDKRQHVLGSAPITDLSNRTTINTRTHSNRAQGTLSSITTIALGEFDFG